jgi:hypothetical protein
VRAWCTYLLVGLHCSCIYKPQRLTLAENDSGDAGTTSHTRPIPTEVAECSLVSCADDCDGIPDYRDPEPQLCNELLYEDVFDDDPASTWSYYDGAWQWQPESLEQNLLSDVTAWARADDAGLSTSEYLVEARVRLGSIGNDDWWEVSVLGRYQHWFPNMACGIHHILVFNPPVDPPDVRVELRRDDRDYDPDPTASGWSAAWPAGTPPDFDPGPGNEYVLQLWYTQNPAEQVFCRLADEETVVRWVAYELWRDTRYDAHLPTAPGSVGFRTLNRAAAFDYIRVFRLHDTVP